MSSDEEGLGMNSSSLRNDLTSKESYYRMLWGNQPFSKKLLVYFMNRAKCIDDLQRKNSRTSFIKRTERILSVVSEYYEAEVNSPKLLDILVKAAAGKTISSEEINFAISLGDKSNEVYGPFGYAFEDHNPEMVRTLLEEISLDPKELAYEIIADLFLTALATPKLFYQESEILVQGKRNINPRAQKVIARILSSNTYFAIFDGFYILCNISEFIGSYNGLLFLLGQANNESKTKDFSFSDVDLRYNLRDHLKPIIEIIKIKGRKHFGFEANRFSKFIDFLPLLASFPLNRNVPLLLFNACFGKNYTVLNRRRSDRIKAMARKIPRIHK